MAEIHSLMLELGKRTGIGDLEFPRDHSLLLQFDNDCQVAFEHDSEDGALLVSGLLGSADPYRNADDYRSLLEASCLGSQTGGGSIALAREANELLLWKRFNDTFPDYAAFETAVNGFIAHLKEWREIIEKGPAANAASSDGAEGAFPAFGLKA